MAKDYPTNEIENADESVKNGYKIIEVVDEKAKQTTYDILKDGKLVYRNKAARYGLALKLSLWR